MTRQGTVRKKTKSRGVYIVTSETRVHKNKPDICFYIAFKLSGRLIWEKVGWFSDGYSEKLAAGIRSDRLRSIRHGDELPQQKKSAITFQELAEKYLKWATTNKATAGVDDKSRYENHLKERFDNKRLDEINLLDLERFKLEMSKTKIHKDKTISPKTIAHCLALIRAMYNKAIDWNLYNGDNPIRKKRPGEKKGIMPKVQNARDRFLTHEEAGILLNDLKRNHQIKKEYKERKDPKLHDMALLALHTGARAGEIFNIKLFDIDTDNSLITLRDTKNGETRYAPMTADVKAMLQRRISEVKNEKQKTKTDKSQNRYIFINQDGKKITEVSNAFENVVDRLGFNKNIDDRRQKVVFHTLRHTFASWLAIQGTPLYTIAKLMGHKSLSMSERYAHLSPDHKKEAIKNFEIGFKKEEKIVNIDEAKK